MADGKSMVICGDVGCGKSHLARAIVQAMTPAKAVFVEETSLVKSIQASYNGEGVNEATITQRCLDAELLVYDDLGSYQTNNHAWMENIYRMIFEHRIAANRPTLVTTNLSFFDGDGGDFGLLSEHIGPRNYDRLLRGIVTDSGPFFANMFGVPSYQVAALGKYLASMQGVY